MTDIQLLYARDCVKLTRQDIDDIIEDIRAKRQSFAKAPVPKTKFQALDLGIDLGI